MIHISSSTVAAVILVVATMIAFMNADTANAFSIPSLTSSSSSSSSSSKRNTPLFSASQDNDLTTSRANFLKRTTVAASAVFWTSSLLQSASAKDDPASLKGTKADPEYEACMSTCIYECTKPKGVEQKSRKECIPECKQTCATSKAQLMIGTPIKKN
jgi:preprotein translocase subunit SecG